MAASFYRLSKVRGMSIQNNITPGLLVIARAGRDKGSVFVATESRQGSVFIADGKRRKLEKPKRKNTKHISPTDTVISLEGLTNKKLRRLLMEYRPNTSQNGDCVGETTEHLRKGD